MVGWGGDPCNVVMRRGRTWTLGGMAQDQIMYTQSTMNHLMEELLGWSSASGDWDGQEAVTHDDPCLKQDLDLG